ncbi:MAG: hypothetical protein AAF483_14135 [Planctomycetota bacterium]
MTRASWNNYIVYPAWQNTSLAAKASALTLVGSTLALTIILLGRSCFYAVLDRQLASFCWQCGCLLAVAIVQRLCEDQKRFVYGVLQRKVGKFLLDSVAKALTPTGIPAAERLEHLRRASELSRYAKLAVTIPVDCVVILCVVLGVAAIDVQIIAFGTAASLLILKLVRVYYPGNKSQNQSRSSLSWKLVYGCTMFFAGLKVLGQSLSVESLIVVFVLLSFSAVTVNAVLKAWYSLEQIGGLAEQMDALLQSRESAKEFRSESKNHYAGNVFYLQTLSQAREGKV